jgi:SAM-dependent methyltransferase
MHESASPPLQQKPCAELAVVCDLCRGKDVLTVLPIGQRSLVKCCSCGLVRIDPITTAAELDAVYDQSDYYTTRPAVIPRNSREVLRMTVLAAFWGYPSPSGRPVGWLHRLLLRPLKYRVMPVQFPTGKPVVDVGCGNGERLLELQQCGHDQLFGIEPTQGAAKQARLATNATIYSLTLEEAPLNKGHFGLVILNQVLEHVPSPRSTLKCIRELLRPDGTLYLTVPNFGSFEADLIGQHWAGLRIPEHLHHFTPTPLRRLLEEAGFSIVVWRTDSVPSITQESFGAWSRAKPTAWRRFLARLPRSAIAAATLPADMLGRGQMLRVVAVLHRR